MIRRVYLYNAAERTLAQPRGQKNGYINHLKHRYKVQLYATCGGFEGDLIWEALKASD
jgi:hypothetical protein